MYPTGDQWCYVKADNEQDTLIVAPVPLFVAFWFAFRVK